MQPVCVSERSVVREEQVPSLKTFNSLMRRTAVCRIHNGIQFPIFLRQSKKYTTSRIHCWGIKRKCCWGSRWRWFVIHTSCFCAVNYCLSKLVFQTRRETKRGAGRFSLLAMHLRCVLEYYWSKVEEYAHIIPISFYLSFKLVNWRRRKTYIYLWTVISVERERFCKRSCVVTCE